MQKNLLKNTIKPIKTERTKYLISLIIYLFGTIFIGWVAQFFAFSQVERGSPLYMLLALIISSWFPFFLALILLLVFRLPTQLLCLIPKVTKKTFWAIILPLLVAVIGFQFSIHFVQIHYQELDAPLFLAGNSIFSALHLFLVQPIAIFLFTCIFAIGLEILFRGFLLELLKKLDVSHGWFYSGILQFICFFPFIWAGYFGGHSGSILYSIFFVLLFVSQSGFLFWLSIFSDFSDNMKKEKNINRKFSRSLLVPMLSACVFYNIYFFIAIKFFVENGNIWMSGPANVITVMLQLFITIFLLMTKRLKY